MRRPTILTVAGVVAAVACILCASIILGKPRYPYGWSHCCDKMIAMEMFTYADQHQGWFPRGEATPEASFSLLYNQQPEIGPHLAGKAVPMQESLDLLATGKPLTAKTCSWQYVEGLRRDDPAELALFWDKTGLGHNGEELRQKGRFVCFVSLEIKFIPNSQWKSFLANQAALKRNVGRPVTGLSVEQRDAAAPPHRAD